MRKLLPHHKKNPHCLSYYQSRWFQSWSYVVSCVNPATRRIVREVWHLPGGIIMLHIIFKFVQMWTYVDNGNNWICCTSCQNNKNTLDNWLDSSYVFHVCHKLTAQQSDQETVRRRRIKEFLCFTFSWDILSTSQSKKGVNIFGSATTKQRVRITTCYFLYFLKLRAKDQNKNTHASAHSCGKVAQ